MSSGEPGIGHNSGVGEIAADRLRSFVERVERLADEKAAIMEDIKQVLAEAKATGFAPKIIRKVIQRRKLDPADKREQDDMLAIYEDALSDDLLS